MTKKTVVKIFRTDGKAKTDRQIRAEAKRKLKPQHAEAQARAKYGPSGKPAKVTVRSLDTGVQSTAHQNCSDGPTGSVDQIAEESVFGRATGR
jgi:hypothetical protein